MNHSVTMQSKQVRGITCTKCMLTLKDSDCNYSLLKNQVINWKWKLPPLHLRLIRQWFKKHVGGRRAWRGSWRVCTPHPTLTSTFWVGNHFTYFFFVLCWQVLKGGLWLDCHGNHLVAQNITVIFCYTTTEPSNTVSEVC